MFTPSPIGGGVAETVIVDPSLVLSGFGIGLVDRLARQCGTRPWIMPLLARLLRESDSSQAAQLIPELAPHLVIADTTLARRLERWRGRLADGPPPFQSLTSPRDARRASLDDDIDSDLEQLRRRHNAIFKGMVIPYGLKAGSMAFIDQFYLQQVALAAALFEDGPFVLCRAEPEPAFWTWLNTRRFLSCRHVKDPAEAAGARERTRQWVNNHGLEPYTFAGLSYGMVHFLFPEPALFTEMDENTFAGSWAFLLEP